MKKLLLSVFIGLMSLPLLAQWSNNDSINLQINKFENYSVEVHRHTNGDVYIVNDASGAGGINIHLQILSAAGEKRFPGDGLLISDKPTSTYTVINELSYLDKDGNIIIGAEDYRLDPTKEKSTLSLYKISPSGEFLWGKDGINFFGENGVRAGRVSCTRIVQITDGSYIVMCTPLDFTDAEHPARIEMQRISADGKFLWDEVKYIQDPDNAIMYPYVVDAGNNEVIVLFSKGANQDLYAKKIDFDGNDVWTTDTRVYKSGFPSVPLHVVLHVVPCGNGGALVSWYDDRNSTNIESVYCSYIKNDGTLGFASGEEGQKVGYEGFRSFRPKGIYDKENNCIFVVWEENSANQGYKSIKLQKLNMEGELLWDAYGIPVVPLRELNIGSFSVQLADQGGAAVFYLEGVDPQKPYGDALGLAALLNADGSFRWKEKIFTSAPALKTSLLSTHLYNNQYVMLWEDERGGPVTGGAPLYAQNINLEGRIGNVSNEIVKETKEFSISAYPNPVSDQVSFSLDNYSGAKNASIIVYNQVGQIVSQVFNGRITAGVQQISWTKPSSLSAGIYFAKVQVGERSTNIKLMFK